MSHPLNNADADAGSQAWTSATSASPTKTEAGYSVYKSKTKTKPSSVTAARSSSAMSGAPIISASKRAVSAGSISQSLQPISGTATTSTSNVEASPTSITGQTSSTSSVASKLKLQSLQASLKAAHLTPESIGWQIVQRLVSPAPEDAQDPAWRTLHVFLRLDNAHVLLPRESSPPSAITPSLLANHIFIRAGVALYFTNGLTAVCSDSQITFMDCLPPVDLQQPDEAEESVRVALSRVILMANDADSDDGGVRGDKIERTGKMTFLLPKSALTTTASSSNRPGRSFVGLFGGQRTVSASSARISGSEDQSPHGGELSSTGHSQIDGWLIAQALPYLFLCENIAGLKGLRVRAQLQDEDREVINLCMRLLNRFWPLKDYPLRHESPDASQRSLEEVSLLESSIDSITTALQEFYYDIGRRLEQVQLEQLDLAEAMSEPEKSKASQTDHVDHVKVMEAIENFVCRELYWRLFSPVGSSDSREDQLLSARITALQLLDLSLDNLGIDLSFAQDNNTDWEENRRLMREGLDTIIDLCKKEFLGLQRSDSRSPRAKLDTLVRVHKIIADRLDLLPPMRLKADGDDGLAATATANNTPKAAEPLEMSDNVSSLKRSRSNLGLNTPDENALSLQDAAVDVTSRIASRPASAVGSHTPGSRLPEAALTHGYAIPMGRQFTESSDPSTTSYYAKHTTKSVNSKSPRSTTSADVILPLLIYVVVQTNPEMLVSHVLYVQRFRADSLMRGEGEYCLTNMDAVRAFLTACDLGSLGLPSEKVTSVDTPAQRLRMRDHASQSIDHVVGSAGKVLGLAGDIGLGGARIVGGLFSRTSATIDYIRQPKTIEDVQEVLSGADSTRSRSLTDTLLRRPAASPSVVAEMQDASALTNSREQDESSTTAPDALNGDAPASLASRLAALPGISGFATTTAEPSKAAISSAEPATTASAKGGFFAALSAPLLPLSKKESDPGGVQEPSTPARPTSPLGKSRDRGMSLAAQLRDPVNETGGRNRTGSTASEAPSGQRQDLASRLANIAAGKHTPTTSINSTPGSAVSTDSAKLTDRPSRPNLDNIDPPVQRFLTANAADLRISDVAVLLADYKRLAGAWQK